MIKFKARMITTSNFARSSKDPNAVAISQGVPRWYKGRRYMVLAPSLELLDAKEPELFDREYRKQLAALNPQQVAEGLGPDTVLCFVGNRSTCAAIAA